MTKQILPALTINTVRIWLAMGLYLVSLVLPGLHLIDGNMVYGWRLLLVAWYGFLIMQIPWLANVFFFVGMFLLRNDQTYRYAGFLGFAAFAVGLLSYRSKVWIAHHTLIDQLGSGFYVWMAAFLILASFVWVPNKTETVDRDVSDKKETWIGEE